MEIYFVACRGCGREIVIDCPPGGGRPATISGQFNPLPDCPHCGESHPYAESDIKSRLDPEGDTESAKEFLRRIDTGRIDRSISDQIKELPRAQLEEIAEILLARSTKNRKKS
jgi:hypothetical protein